jgi:hypothetical protein
MSGKQVCVIGKSSDKDEKAIIGFMKDTYGVKCWVESNKGKRVLMTDSDPNKVLAVVEAVFNIGKILDEIKAI